MPFEQRVGQDDMLKGDFAIEIDGVAKTAFRTLSGGAKEYGEITSRDGNDKQKYRKQDGIMTVEDITLTEGRTTDVSELHAWFEDRGRKAISIVQFDHNGDEVKRWNCFACRLKRIEPFDFDAMAEDPAINSVVISLEDWERA